MTIFHCEGFETLGIKTTSAANLESRIGIMPLTHFQEQSGGHTDDIEIIDDFETAGFALQMPEALTGRGTLIVFEWPSAYKVTNNASHPVIISGFRYYNADSDPAATRTIWGHMTSATGGNSSLGVASNGVDLVWTDNTGSQTISSVLTADTWHYIELEFKATTGANGGYVKVYVDGTLQWTGTTRNITQFTFLSSYGTRVGQISTSNEVSGNKTAFDDVYQLEMDGVDHTGPLGPVRVLLLSPTSDATPNDWTPSAGGDNYALIDEQDWDTADYVDATTTGDDDHYGLTTLSGAGTVHALQIDVVCEAVDGSPNLHIGFDDGTADESDEGTIATGGTSMVRQLFVDDPSGSGWSQSSVNSVEATQRMTE